MRRRERNKHKTKNTNTGDYKGRHLQQRDSEGNEICATQEQNAAWNMNKHAQKWGSVGRGVFFVRKVTRKRASVATCGRQDTSTARYAARAVREKQSPHKE